MPLWLDLQTHVTFPGLLPEVDNAILALLKVFQDTGEDDAGVEGVERISTGSAETTYNANIWFHGHVSEGEARTVERHLNVLGRLAARVAVVLWGMDGDIGRYYIGPRQQSIRACQLRDAAASSAEALLGAAGPAFGRTLANVALTEGDVAKVLEALFSGTPVTFVKGCYPDDVMRPGAFMWKVRAVKLGNSCRRTSSGLRAMNSSRLKGCPTASSSGCCTTSTRWSCWTWPCA